MRKVLKLYDIEWVKPEDWEDPQPEQPLLINLLFHCDCGDPEKGLHPGPYMSIAASSN